MLINAAGKKALSNYVRSDPRLCSWMTGSVVDLDMDDIGLHLRSSRQKYYSGTSPVKGELIIFQDQESPLWVAESHSTGDLYDHPNFSGSDSEIYMRLAFMGNPLSWMLEREIPKDMELGGVHFCLLNV